MTAASRDVLEPLVLAGFRLAVISIAAQLKAGALSQSQREDSAQILDEMCEELEQIATDGELARSSLLNVRALIDRLSDQAPQ